MSDRAVEDRQNRASDIIELAFYSILVLLLMLLWVYASSLTFPAVRAGMPPGIGRKSPDVQHEAARVHIAARRCGGGVAHSPPAVRDAGDWLREQLASDHLRLCYRVSTGLERTGLVEGSDFAIEYRSTGDQIDRLPAIVADLVAAGSNPISDARHGALRTTGAWSGERRTCRYLGFQAGTPGSHSTFFEPSLSLRRLRTRPARKPRTEVLLPASRLHNSGNRCPCGLLQHGDDARLLRSADANCPSLELRSAHSRPIGVKNCRKFPPADSNSPHVN